MSSSVSASAPQLASNQIVNKYGDVESSGNLTSTDWTRRWAKEQTKGFHRNDPNPQLVEWLEKNGLMNATSASSSKPSTSSKGTILVPLCGKSVDLIYLYQQGFTVVGIEVVTQAIVDFFYDNSNILTKYTVEKLFDGIYRYSTPDGRLSIVQADIFSSHLTKEILLNSSFTLGFDYVWDRASIVAINPHQRQQYVTQIESWLNTSKSTYLIMTYEYNQAEMHGPPFSVEEDVVSTLFSKWTRDLVTQFSSQMQNGQDKPTVTMQNKLFAMKRK